MDIREQVKKLVENKIEKIIVQDLKDKIIDEEQSFDVEAYVDYLIDKYFKDNEIRNSKENLNTDSYDSFYLGSENSTNEKNSSHDSLELESNECQNFSAEEIIKYLKSDSQEVKKESLQALEASAEDLINQSSWNEIKEALQKILFSEESREIQNMILKVFQRLLKQPKKPQIICQGFISTTDVLTNQINFFNSKDYGCTSSKKIYDVEAKWCSEKKSSDINSLHSTIHKDLKFLKEELLIKLMWLLIDCQQQIPIKWMRFNESRFREIIFAFIHLLSSTSTLEVAKLSGLEILSVLSPTANWCRYWCHTAIGRSLLCTALRKYKHFFVQIVEIILKHLKIKKDNRLPLITDGISLNEKDSKYKTNITDTLKPFKKSLNKIEREKTYPKIGLFDDRSHIRSAPSELKDSKSLQYDRQKKTNSEWVITNVPKEIVNEAVFFHSVSFVSCLIQYRSGRALFPIQTATRTRLLSVQDLSVSIIEYLENFENYKRIAEIKFTSTYQAKVAEILDILKKVKTQINSSRMSAERYNFSYF